MNKTFSPAVQVTDVQLYLNQICIANAYRFATHTNTITSLRIK